jgi:hypothetical protein
MQLFWNKDYNRFFCYSRMDNSNYLLFIFNNEKELNSSLKCSILPMATIVNYEEYYNHRNGIEPGTKPLKFIGMYLDVKKVETIFSLFENESKIIVYLRENKIKEVS